MKDCLLLVYVKLELVTTVMHCNSTSSYSFSASITRLVHQRIKFQHNTHELFMIQQFFPESNILAIGERWSVFWSNLYCAWSETATYEVPEKVLILAIRFTGTSFLKENNILATRRLYQVFFSLYKSKMCHNVLWLREPNYVKFEEDIGFCRSPQCVF